MKDLREYYRPATAQEAVALKQEFGTRAVYLAGATDLLVNQPAGVEVAIDIRHAGLNGIDRADGMVHIGGAALLRDAERAVTDVAGGMLTESLRHTAPWVIRNAATVAGNIANASPAADSVPALLALDASLTLLSSRPEQVDLNEVFVGPHATVLADRLIQSIDVPAVPGRRATFIKLARSLSDIAQVNVAVSFLIEGDTVRDARIALGAVAPTPSRARQAEALLEGRALDEATLHEVDAAVRAEVSPISDWRASAEYRRRMSGVLVRRALQQAVATLESVPA